MFAYNRVIAEIFREVKRDRSPAKLHSLAVCQLLRGLAAKAVPSLEEALFLDTGKRDVEQAFAACHHPALLQDTAAALIERASIGHNPAADLSAAVTAADRSIALAPHSGALFARALALERLGLYDDAADGWRQVIINSTVHSQWTAEARVHLDSLVGRRFGSNETDIGSTRRLVEDELLPHWGAAWKSGHNTEASILLGRARIAADRVAETGDPLLRRAVALIDSSNGASRAILATLHASYGDALRDYAALNVARAAPEFRQLSEAFARAGSPFGCVAAVREAGCSFYRNDFKVTLQRSQILAAATKGIYPATYARARWLAGLAHLALFQPFEAIADYDAALAVMTEIHDVPARAAVEGLLTEAWMYFGDREKADAYRRSALRDAYRSQAQSRLHIILSEAANAAIRDGRFAEAQVAVNRLVIMGRTTDNPAFIADTLLRKALLSIAVGDEGAAKTALAAARDAARQLREEAPRRRVESMIAVASATFGSRADLDAAREAISFYESTGNAFGLTDALSRRGRALILRGDLLGAAQSLEEALKIAHREAARIRDHEQRTVFIEERQDLFDALVDVACRTSRWEAARRYAELSHQGVLLQASAADVAAVPANRLAPDSMGIEYFVGEQYVYAWITTAEGITPTRLTVTPRALADAVATAGTDLDAKAGSGARAALRRLYDMLIAPAGPLVGRAATVVISPDKFLYNVPFAALLDPSGRHLIERLSVVVTPSLATYHPSAPRRARRRTALLVASHWAPDTPDLRLSLFECSRIAQMYEAPTLLLGHAAHVESVLRAMSNADVIHVAAHALANADHPSLSAVVLGSADSPSVLYARDIGRLNLRAHPVVFLSACGTGASGDRRAGVTSIAAAFLSAGASEVIATLWPIEDEAAASFAVEFHRRLRQGATPTQAIRATQLARLQSNDPSVRRPAVWGAYEIIESN